MPIAFDAAASSAGGAITSLTFSQTCTGSNRLLFVGVLTRNATTNADVVTGITYATVAMTRLNTVAGSTSCGREYLYYLIASATGANDVVISTSLATDIHGQASSYTGALQSGVPDASGTNTGTAVTSIATSVTTVLDNCWMVSSSGSNNEAPAAGTGTTSRSSINRGSIGDNNAAITPAGANSMTWTTTGSVDIAVCQASFAPILAAAVGGMPFMWA